MNNSQPGFYLLIAIVSMAVSMAIIPLMIRYAATFGMVDMPDPRKVHSSPIPRVGGVGVVIGALVPMYLWLPVNQLFTSFIFGSIVLLVFGIWDDIKQLGHYHKFAGQLIAALAVVYYGDLYVMYFPFIGLEQIPESIGKVFTVVALVGVINALNHSDGLDGLAGGESLLSLGAIIYLSYLYDDTSLLLIAVVTMAGIFGFLRFNSHPARVFMGDGGSQFLGFTLGVLVVFLTQETNTALSPALPLLLLGLPIIDILAVFFLRAKGKMNLFKATKNHIHHRLLDLGFYHYESVVVIYSIQTFFVICAVLIPYENDYLISGVYLLTCALVFTSITFSERFNWRMREAHSGEDKAVSTPAIMAPGYLSSVPMYIMETGVTLFLAAAALTSEIIPVDIGLSAFGVLVILVLMAFVSKFQNLYIYRLIVYVSIGFSVYLLSSFPPTWVGQQHYLVYAYFAVLALTTFVVARMTSSDKFNINPMDYLVIIVALILAFTPGVGIGGSEVTWMALQMIILFYSCELLIQRLGRVRSRFSGAIITVLSLIAVRGLL